MKKTFVTFFIFLLLSSFTIAEQKPSKKIAKDKFTTRTYELKYVAPEIVHKTLNSYIANINYSQNGNMVTVMFDNRYPERLKKFEQIMKKLDVKKREVTFRIFTVIASHKPVTGNTIPIKGDLKKVLHELQTIMSFKSFKLDGMSGISALDGQKHGHLTLSSAANLKYSIQNVRITGNKGEGREIHFKFDLKTPYVAKNNWETIQSSVTSIKEGGYLVAGVSKIGENGDSLILVINAYIK